MKITRHSKEFVEAAGRVASGATTREAAAQELGVNPGTFGVWMSRSGIAVDKTEKGTKKPAGAALGWAINDPDKAKALDEATARVLAGEMSVTEASEIYTDVAFATIAARVRRTRERLGIPVQKRRTRAQMEAARAAQGNQQA